MGLEFGCARGVEHIIDIGQHEPIKQRYYPVSPYIQDIMSKEVDKMLNLGIIEPSRSSWYSPVVLVRKPSEEYRFCVDFRKINAITKRDAYPIPYIDMILDRLRNARVLHQ